MRYFRNLLVLVVLPFTAPLWLLVAQQPDKKEPSKPAAEKKEDAKAEPKRTGLLRPADLALEAEQTREHAIRDMYQRLSITHDLIHWKDRDRKPSRVEPVARFVDVDTDFRNPIRIYVLDPKGKKVTASYAERSELSSIEPYEEIALTEVKTLLDPKGPAKSARRLEVLQAAERALTVVVRFHDSSKSNGMREGAAWEPIGKKLRERLVQVQVDMLGALAEADDWDHAYAQAARLAESHPRGEVQGQLARQMARFVNRSLQADNYAEVNQRLKLLREIFTDDALSGPVNETLSRKAAELFAKAKKEKDKAKAVALLTTAENLWPRLQGLRDYRLQLSNAYPILYVGVSELPERFSPAAACTDAERWASELLFESLIQESYEPGVGERYRAVLATGRPSQIPLGREFALARDAYWSDGTPVTGVDVRRTLQLLRQQGSANLLEDARLDNAYQVRLILKQGFIDPLALMTFKILPESARLERLDDPAFAKKPIGSGPFVFQKREEDAVIFSANHNYRRAKQGLPRIREVRFVQAKDPVNAFARGRLHLLLDPEAVPRVRTVDRVKTHVLPNRRIYFLAVNHRKTALQDQELRVALAKAIDREGILNSAFRADWKDEGKPHRALTSVYPPGSWPARKDAKADLYAPERAKALMGKCKEKVGSTKLTLKYPNDDTRVTRACEAIRAQVAAAGLELQLEACSPAELRKAVEQDHKYDLAYYHWDYTSEAYLSWPLFDPNASRPGGSNFLGYQPDSELLKWFQAALNHREFAKVVENTRAIEMELEVKMPLIPLWQLDTLLAIQEGIKTAPDVNRLDPLRVFTDVEQWELK
jgi:peptide/nickel transport system substrate-binding protein